MITDAIMKEVLAAASKEQRDKLPALWAELCQRAAAGLIPGIACLSAVPQLV